MANDTTKPVSASTQKATGGGDGSKAATPVPTEAIPSTPSPAEELKAIFGQATAKPATPATPATKPTEPKASESTPAPPEPPKAPPTTPVAPEVIAPLADTPKDPKQLREAYEKAKRRMVELEAKLGDYEDVTKKHATLAEQYDKASQRLATLEEELKFADYVRTDDYKSKYLAPITKASEDFGNEFVGYVREDGKETSAEELGAFLDTPPGRAPKLAKEMFGDMASEAMFHYRKIRDLDRDRKTAIETYRTSAVEREKQWRANQDAATLKMKKAYEESFNELLKAEPTIFGEVADQEEANEKLAEGYAFVDTAFNGQSDLTPENRAKALAKIRAKAGAFDRVHGDLQSARKKISELETELDKYRKSEPGDKGIAPVAPTPDGSYVPFDKELREMMPAWR